MKTNKLLVAMMLVLASGLVSAQTETTATLPVSDGELTAQAFLTHDVAYCKGWFSFLREMLDGSSYTVSGEFTLNNEGWVTSLTIDGKPIVGPGDEPLAGLPANKVGSAVKYSLTLVGYDKNQEYAVNGGFYTDLLLPGDPILVTLHPGYEERFIPFNVPAGVNPNDLRIRINTCDGVWIYDPYRQGFSLWIDPTMHVDYEIFNAQTGEIYERGEVGGSSESAGDNIVSTTYSGVSASLMDSSQYWDNLLQANFDSYVERGGGLVPAKVIMTRAYDQAMTIQGFYLPTDGRIEVRAWAPAGEEMPLIAVAQAVTVITQGSIKGGGGSYSFAYLETPIGYDKLVVTITGTPGQDFDVYLNRGTGKG